MNALKFIKNDHDTFKKLLKELDETTDEATKTRQQKFTRLHSELVAHETMEEQVLYPKLREARKEAEEIVKEGYEEHHVADLILDELSQLAVDDEMWGAKLAVLKESVEHHIKEEEEKMFEHARKAFSDDELEKLGKQMESIKQQTKQQQSAA